MVCCISDECFFCFSCFHPRNAEHLCHVYILLLFCSSVDSAYKSLTALICKACTTKFEGWIRELLNKDKWHFVGGAVFDYQLEWVSSFNPTMTIWFGLQMEVVWDSQSRFVWYMGALKPFFRTMYLHLGSHWYRVQNNTSTALRMSLIVFFHFMFYSFKLLKSILCSLLYVGGILPNFRHGLNAYSSGEFTLR